VSENIYNIFKIEPSLGVKVNAKQGLATGKMIYL
jgi:hypothetical protein